MAIVPKRPGRLSEIVNDDQSWKKILGIVILVSTRSSLGKLYDWLPVPAVNEYSISVATTLST